MKKLSISIIIILLVVLTFVFIYTKNNSINKGDIFTNVSIKNDIPKINSRSEAGIVIFDSENNITYTITYNGKLLSKPYISVSVSKKSEESYRYSWEYIEEDLIQKTVSLPDGWSIHKTNNGYDNYFLPIQNLPIDSINGTVNYTKGNTSLIKKILIGL